MTEIKIGKYKVLGELGRGAMGIVYKAEDPYIGRTVAVKTIRFDSAGPGAQREDAQRRFLREAQSAGGISHPNIVTVYDVGEDRGTTYIAMAYIDGSSMEDLLESGVKFTVEDALALIIPIADALESAHRKGIIHRDIKPGNILIDQDGRPYLADFGIARVSSSTMTQTSMVMGTPFYMSPEQVAGKKVDNRSDIFALGAVLYEMLTLQKPFSGESLTTVIYKIMNENPPPVRSIQRNVPEGIDDVISRALAKDPEARYRNCRELIADLKNYSRYAERPLPAQEPPIERAAVFQEAPAPLEYQTERNRKPLLIILASMMTLVIAVAALFFFLGRDPKAVPSPSGGGGLPGSETTPHIAAADPFREALDFWAARNYSAALGKFEEVLALSPDHYEAQMGKAGVLKDQGRREEAAVEYEKAIALSGSDSRPHLILGEIFQDKGDYENALAVFRRGLSVMSAGPEADAVSRIIADLEVRPALARPDTPTDIEPREADTKIVDTFPDKPETKDQEKPEVKVWDKPETKDQDKPETKVEDKPEVKVRDKPETKVEDKPEVKVRDKPDIQIAKKKDVNPYIERGTEAYNAGDYEKAAQLMEFVLENDPQNIYAREFLSLATKKLEDQRRERHIRFDMDNATDAMRKGAYGSAIEDLRKVLAADSSHAEAGRLLGEALAKITPGEIGALVNQYVEAVQNHKMTGFYQKYCSPELFKRISRDTDMIVGTYAQLTAIAANVRVAFRDSRHDSFKVEARFSHIMTGVSRESGRRESLFDGVYTWTLERRGDSWRITNISFETAKKLP